MKTLELDEVKSRLLDGYNQILTLVLTYILISFGFAEDLPYLDGFKKQMERSKTKGRNKSLSYLDLLDGKWKPSKSDIDWTRNHIQQMSEGGKWVIP